MSIIFQGCKGQGEIPSFSLLSCREGDGTLFERSQQKSLLQAVLSDFEDAYNHLEEDAKDVKREIQLVADSLRLGGAILGK